MARYINVSNPAAIGVEVETTLDGDTSRMQFVVLRGAETAVRFAMHGPNGWSSMSSIVNPERFAPTIPKTYAELRAFAEAFVKAGEGE